MFRLGLVRLSEKKGGPPHEVNELRASEEQTAENAALGRRPHRRGSDRVNEGAIPRLGAEQYKAFGLAEPRRGAEGAERENGRAVGRPVHAAQLHADLEW